MPYIFTTFTGEEARVQATAHDFPPDLVERTHKLVVMCSSFQDPGDDWCEYQIFTKSGSPLDHKRVPGY